MSRLLKKYREQVVPNMMKEFKYTTPMQVPQLKKVVINMGVGDATQNGKAIEFAEYALTKISGQKPVITKSKKAIASFKLKENQAIGCMVTLRKEKMYSFLDRLFAVALPRVRDFRGVPTRGFDGRGSYTLGIREQIVFPEVEIDKLDKVRGMNITFVTNAKSDDEGRSLLENMGMPFRKQASKE